MMMESQGKKGYVKCLGIPCNVYFVFGFIILAFVPLPLDFIALSNAGQSLIIPVGTGMTIVWNQILSPLVLKETFSRQDMYATSIIVIGVLVSTLFGTHASPVYTADTLLSFFGRAPFLILLFFVIVSQVCALLCIHFPKKTSKNLQLLALGYAPAIFGSLQIMFFKVVGELNKNTFDGVPVQIEKDVNGTKEIETSLFFQNEFLSWRIYVFVVFVVILAVMQFTYMNRGLSEHDAIKYLPVYNTFLLMSSVVIGSIFFNEIETFHPIAFPLGCVCLILGIRQLAYQQLMRIVPVTADQDRDFIVDNESDFNFPKEPMSGDSNRAGNTSSADSMPPPPPLPPNFCAGENAKELMPHEEGFMPSLVASSLFMSHVDHTESAE